MEPYIGDISTGYWVKGVPYRLEHASRLYERPVVTALNSTCSNMNVMDMFGEYPKESGSFPTEGLYMEGRHFYRTAGVVNDGELPQENEIEPMALNVSPYYTSLYQAYEETYLMYPLICKPRDLKRPIDMKFLNSIRCTPSCDGVCTTIGSKIAKSLIRIASTRIFANPWQSIMEPIVNSIDAYSPKSKVGKFGMGFFSFLYWLIGHPTRYLDVVSYTVEDGTPTTFKIRIQDSPNGLTFNLRVYDSSVRRTGTSITLECALDSMDYKDLDSAQDYIGKLSYVTDASIYEGVKYTVKVTEDSTSPNQIFVHVARDRIHIEDYATGIPLNVVFSSLFIPSVSTKMIRSHAIDRGWKNTSRVVSSTRLPTRETSLHITVSNITVVSIMVSTEHSFVETIVLTMPPNTKLPVSRDDIILTEDTIPAMHEGLNMVIEHLAVVSRDVSVLQSLLEKYMTKTSVHTNIEVMSNRLAYMNDKYESQYVIPKYNSLYKNLFKDRTEAVIISNYSLETKLTKYLDAIIEHPITDMFSGYRVVIVESGDNIPDISNGGTESYMFINQRYIDSLGSDWVVKISLSHYTNRLVSDKEVEKTRHGKYIAMISTALQGSYRDDKKAIMMDILNRDSLVHSTFEKSSYEKSFEGTESEIERADVIFDRMYRLCIILDDAVFGMNIPSPINILRHYILWNVYFDSEPRSVIYSDLLYNEMTQKLAKLKTARKDYGVGFSSVVEGTYASINYKKKRIIHPHMRRMTYEMMKLVIRGILPTHAYYTFPSMTDKILLRGGLFLRMPLHYNRISTSLEPIEYMCSLCRDGMEYLMMSMVLSQLHNIRPSSFWYDLSNDIVKHIYDEIRADSSIMDAMRVAHTYLWFCNDDIMIAKSMTIANLIHAAFFSKQEHTVRYSPTVFVPAEKVFTRLSDVINEAFVNDYTNFFDLMEASTDKTSSVAKNFQLIEIAVNEGTTKPFYQAVITELVQNSVDAIREFKPKDIRLSVELARDENTLHLSVTDRVGMTSSALISLSVPFLSGKTASELVTGEMGSGFFNVYRDSNSVVIITKDPNTKDVYKISDSPIRQDGRVVDIVRAVGISDIGVDGTTVTVTKTYSNMRTLEADVELIHTYVRNIIRPIDLPIEYNGIPLGIDREQVYENKYFKLIHVRYGYIPSYIYTKGIPFAEMTSYISDKNILTKDLVSALNGVIIDVKHSAYIPVQSRTSIIMDKDALKSFISILQLACYVSIIHQIADGAYDGRVPISNYTSKTRPADALPNIRFADTYVSIKDMVENYTGDINKKISIAMTIARCTSFITTREIPPTHADLDEFIDRLVKHTYDAEIADSVAGIVKMWFEFKDLSPREEQIAVKKIKVNVGTADPAFRDLSNVLTKWVEAYWTVGKRLGIVGIAGDPPPVVVSVEDEKYDGMYRRTTNTIHIRNTIPLLTADSSAHGAWIVKILGSKDIKLITKSLDRTLVGHTVELAFLMAFTNPAAILIHELEHARAKTEETAGTHNDLMLRITEKDAERSYSYDERCNEIYAQILAGGLYDVLFSIL
uniref:Uncharacterized protein n=1 Tax=viral metagenome TaxID=1070528 RepID=A0A6C0M057_9ZZZZ